MDADAQRAENNAIQKFHNPDERERSARIQNASTVTSLKVTRAQTAPGWEMPRDTKVEKNTHPVPVSMPTPRYRSTPAARYGAAPAAQSGRMLSYAARTQAQPTLLDGPLQQKEQKKLRSLFIKTFVCAALLAAVLLLKYIDTPETKTVLNSVYATVTQDMDIDDTLGKLKFVQADPDGSVAVSGSALSAALPGEIKTTYANAPDGRVCVSLPYGSTVRTPLGGTVMEVGESADGGYIQLSCDADVRMMFYGLEHISLKANDTFEAGQALGTTGKSGLIYIAAMQNDQAADPISFYNQ